MNISQNFKKAPWVRRVHPDKVNQTFVRGYKPMPGGSLTDYFIQLTASDFLNELSPAAHEINSNFLSTRPIWRPTEDKKDGKTKWVLDGYDELESVALGWQQFIVGNKVAHMTGNCFTLAKETKGYDEEYDELLSWMDAVGIHDAWTEAVMYCEHCGDSGILLQQTADGEIDWEVYAYEDKGHTIYPQVDENGNPIYYISYMKDGKQMCDVISTKYIEKWVAADPDSEEDSSFFERLWTKYVQIPTGVRSDDGYVRIYRKDAQAGSDLCQFIYFRVPDVSWGPAELSIEEHENAASYVANEVKDSAFPLLVMKAEKITSMPPSKTNGKTIAIKGTADSLAHSDVRYESPADASNIATVHFNELNNNIMRTTQSVLITPEIMKQGADSSTAIKILFRPEIQWAKQRWVYYNKPVRQLVKVFKVLAGKIEGDLDRYTKIRTSVWFEPWIPQNVKENTDIVTAKVYARLMSRKAAQNELGSPYRGDYDTVNKEWEDELAMKQKYSANQKDSNPDAPDIDNNDAGKSIAER